MRWRRRADGRTVPYHPLDHKAKTTGLALRRRRLQLLMVRDKLFVFHGWLALLRLWRGGGGG